mmetsp:Transcript_14911/g.32516  ORF Transcript_14911/g.32516 Transcript_14911/m.32516 type:complete len:100 (+) Transcript_14911:202-501(+)
MLRPSFPSVRCFAYEPPGCIFDDKLSEQCEAFVTSFVRHDDLGLYNLQFKMNGIAEAISSPVFCVQFRGYRTTTLRHFEMNFSMYLHGLKCPKLNVISI